MKIKTLLSWGLVGFLVTSCGIESKDPTPFEGKKNEIHDLRSQLKEAKTRNDDIGAARVQQQLNYAVELKAAAFDASETQRVHRKYKILAEVLSDEIEAYEESRSARDSFSDVRDMLSGVHRHDSKDRIYHGPDFTSSYDSLVLDEVKKVFKDFGPLYVGPTVDPKGAPTFTAVGVNKPWSGFWYPFGNNSSLYAGDKSPLAKWDAVLAKKKIKSTSAEVELERYRGFRPDSWEGLCDALAAAAVMTPEPLTFKTIEGITFSPGDQKALLTFSHLKYPRTVYGIPYRGNAETDGTYQDIKPEAFHQLVTTVLGVEKRALVIDDVAGIQVWNKPLYNYRWKIEQDKKYDFAYEVKAYALLIKERSKETDEPTGTQDILAPVYTYRLYVDKQDVKEGKYRVIAGQWTGDSYRDHPDTVSYLHKTGEPLSHNDEFNKNILEFKTQFMNPSSSVR